MLGPSPNLSVPSPARSRESPNSNSNSGSGSGSGSGGNRRSINSMGSGKQGQHSPYGSKQPSPASVEEKEKEKGYTNAYSYSYSYPTNVNEEEGEYGVERERERERERGEKEREREREREKEREKGERRQKIVSSATAVGPVLLAPAPAPVPGQLTRHSTQPELGTTKRMSSTSQAAGVTGTGGKAPNPSLNSNPTRTLEKAGTMPSIAPVGNLGVGLTSAAAIASGVVSGGGHQHQHQQHQHQHSSRPGGVSAATAAAASGRRESTNGITQTTNSASAQQLGQGQLGSLQRRASVNQAMSSSSTTQSEQQQPQGQQRMARRSSISSQMMLSQPSSQLSRNATAPEITVTRQSSQMPTAVATGQTRGIPSQPNSNQNSNSNLNTGPTQRMSSAGQYAIEAERQKQLRREAYENARVQQQQQQQQQENVPTSALAVEDRFRSAGGPQSGMSSASNASHFPFPDMSAGGGGGEHRAVAKIVSAAQQQAQQQQQQQQSRREEKKREDTRQSIDEKDKGKGRSRDEVLRPPKSQRLLSEAGDDRPPVFDSEEGWGAGAGLQRPLSVSTTDGSSSDSFSNRPPTPRRQGNSFLPTLPLQSPRRWAGDDSSADEKRKVPILPRPPRHSNSDRPR